MTNPVQPRALSEEGAHENLELTDFFKAHAVKHQLQPIQTETTPRMHLHPGKKAERVLLRETDQWASSFQVATSFRSNASIFVPCVALSANTWVNLPTVGGQPTQMYQLLQWVCTKHSVHGRTELYRTNWTVAHGELFHCRQGLLLDYSGIKELLPDSSLSHLASTSSGAAYCWLLRLLTTWCLLLLILPISQNLLSAPSSWRGNYTQ